MALFPKTDFKGPAFPHPTEVDDDKFGRIVIPESMVGPFKQGWNQILEGWGLDIFTKKGSDKKLPSAPEPKGGPMPHYTFNDILRYATELMHEDVTKIASVRYTSLADLERKHGKCAGYQDGRDIEVARDLSPVSFYETLAHEFAAVIKTTETGMGHYDIHDEIFAHGKSLEREYFSKAKNELTKRGLVYEPLHDKVTMSARDYRDALAA
jgi:hypothetical protein